MTDIKKQNPQMPKESVEGEKKFHRPGDKRSDKLNKDKSFDGQQK